METRGLDFRAMSCEMVVWVVAADPRAAREHLVAARDFIQAVERQLSRFDPQSELSRLNARSGQAVQVSPLLWAVLTYALDAARQTEGLYDPTVLEALEVAGYDRSFQEVLANSRAPGSPSTGLRAGSEELRATVGRQWSSWRDIQIDPPTRNVTLPPGVRLDLGGIAKGWAAERAADRLAIIGPCLVDAGGDIAARGRPPDQAGWPIGVTNPRNPETDLALLLVKDRGVATSGTDYRRWNRDGVIQHHIIDPRTRRPAQTDLLSATVVAPDAAQADLHALVALLLGAEEGLRYLARQPMVEGLLVTEDGRQLATPGFRWKEKTHWRQP